MPSSFILSRRTETGRLRQLRALSGRFSGLSTDRRRLLIEAALCLAAGRLALWLIPFPRIARCLGELRAPASSSRPARVPGSAVLDIAWAIDRAARHFPFAVLCLPRALAGWQMLRRRGLPAQLHFGASRLPSSPKLLTHAWLECSGIEVTGYPQAHACVELAHFAH